MREKLAYIWWWLTDRGKYSYWGTIDDIKIWNRKLTKPEIKREFKGKSDLVGYWKLK